jgi:hypothetical protein
MNHTKFHFPRPKTLVLAVFLATTPNRKKSVFIYHFSFTMHPVKISTGKTLSREQKGLPLSSGRLRFLSRKSGSHIQMDEVTLRRVLTLPKNNPDHPCPDQKAGSGKRFKVSEEPDADHPKEAARSY